MKSLLLVILLFACTAAVAQKDSMYVTTNVDNQIYSMDFANAKASLFQFFEENGIKVDKQRESKKVITVWFVLNPEQYRKYDMLVPKLGHSTSKNVNTVSNYSKVRDIQLELKYLRQKETSYTKLLNKLEAKSENYLSLWNRRHSLSERIFQKEKELVAFSRKENTFSVNLDLRDEVTSPEYTEVSFVNMPGFEYSRLDIESPKFGTSSEYYNGYFLKYMFTRGKSYITVGAYKAADLNDADTTAFSEMFILGFGQDFYSRHFGRGTRKFFNIYSGYTVGGILATGETEKKYMFYLSPSIGLELFKNKYILLDTRVNYLIPLGDYRNLRGFGYKVSLNFMF